MLSKISCTTRSVHAARTAARLSALLIAAIAATAIAHSQTMQAPDITKVPTLYVVPYAHLDTQWRWEFPQTIGEYLPNTMRVNFDYIEKYPHYVFNWTGANRYRLMKEYYPADYARLRQYVAAGRWFPAGSSVEEGDVNLPSAEGIFRQILYGNEYFRHEFGKASSEYMLPDCFGFPASLPSILAHAGVKGFSTQKLSASWQPAPKVGGPDSPEQTPAGIPFNVGMWFGPDGHVVLAALNPGSYTSNAYTDLSVDPSAAPLGTMPTGRAAEQNWAKRIALDGKVTGVFADYHYVGTGDIGGATRESTVKLLEAIVTKSETVLPTPPQPASAPVSSAVNRSEVRVGEGPVHVIEAAADQMFNDITPAMTTRMPQYTGDLELINHSAGSLTSQAYHKRWVTKNEWLADAAEKSSLIAEWLGARTYPQKRLNDAWMLALAGHFHDTAAGTATPRAYQFAWNDDTIVANQFAGVLMDVTEGVASGLDTRAQGIPLVVFNPLNIDREDVVEAKIDFPHGMPRGVRVRDSDGTLVPAQLQDGKVLFVAHAPSVGYEVYDVEPADAPAENATLHVTNSSLENERYLVKLDEHGDVSSIFDKTAKRELLSAPMRLAITTDIPSTYPAWNMDYEQVKAAPRSYVSGPTTIRIKEQGPVRVSLEVTRETEGSKFVQTISLSAGDAGNRVVFGNSIDWRTLAANLKATVPLSASNANATYNWDLGTIQRPNAQERQFEVASHRWIDLTDASGSFGATLLTDCKNGSDKPNDNTLRLTLLRSPGVKLQRDGHSQGFTDQANQDWGHHEFTFALAGHAGDWRATQTDWQAYRLSDPLIAFATARHAGAMGKQFSFVHLDNSRVRILALKKAEESDELIVRMVELDGKLEPNVTVQFGAPVAAAREVNAQEQPVGDAKISSGALVTSFSAYQPRTFAVRLAKTRMALPAIESIPVQLRYDAAVATANDTKTPNGGFDAQGDAMPAEMIPVRLDYNNVSFKLAEAKTGSPNAMTASGQTIDLPPGAYNRVYVLAASASGDQTAKFAVGSRQVSLTVQGWSGFVGQWDNRVWKNERDRTWAVSATHATGAAEKRPPLADSPRYPEDYVRLDPGYVKPANIAWYASHQHDANGLNLPYQYCYLFAYSIEKSEGDTKLTLPMNDKIKILAISVARESPSVVPVQPLYDTLGSSEPLLQ
jgi:alpha-mannosidase